MTDDAGVLATAVPLLRVAAVFQISDGLQAVGAGVLRGAGETRFTFAANMVGHWAIGLPASLLLGFTLGGGVVGLWGGFCFGLTAVAGEPALAVPARLGARDRPARRGARGVGDEARLPARRAPRETAPLPTAAGRPR